MQPEEDGPFAVSDDTVMNEQVSLIQQFINYLRAERHFSPHTSKCYTADLHQFCGHLCRPAVQVASGGGEGGPDDNGHARRRT